MKKIVILSPLVLFLFACQKNSVEPNDLPQHTATSNNNFVDSMDIWTRNIQENYQGKVDKTNYTDKNNLKQGKWVIVEIGEGVKTVFYKDGKIVEGC